MRIQGIEPWSVPWEGTMIPLHQMRWLVTMALYYNYNIVCGLLVNGEYIVTKSCYYSF